MYNKDMKTANLVLLVVLSLLTNACIPVEVSATPSSSPLPVDTSTAVFLTETLAPIETPSDTPLPALTETQTSSPTLPSSPMPNASETVTPTLSAVPTQSPGPITIPGLNDWDAGSLAFSHGSEGEWDHILWGGFANSLIRKGDTYYLYYQGSLSYDSSCESVSQRAIGVATSTDGIHWVKSANNPVVSWSSQGSVEEGAASSAAWLGADGRVYLYYGANTGSGCNVNASARLAVSDDGVNFQDMGEVLSGMDPNVWGSGDEIFPVGVYSHENQWYLYYIPNGVAFSRILGVGIGGSPTSFAQSTGLNGSTIPAWGPVSIVLDGSNAVLITNLNDGSGVINIYRFTASNPALVQMHDSYAPANCTQVSVIYESSTHHWMMSCRDQNAENYYIRNAVTP